MHSLVPGTLGLGLLLCPFPRFLTKICVVQPENAAHAMPSHSNCVPSAKQPIDRPGELVESQYVVSLRGRTSLANHECTYECQTRVFEHMAREGVVHSKVFHPSRLCMKCVGMSVASVEAQRGYVAQTIGIVEAALG